MIGDIWAKTQSGDDILAQNVLITDIRVLTEK